jgi:hypothetical protein
MPKRHEDALAIQIGACKPSGIAHAIIDACQEARDEGKQAATDAAVRLMVHQLAFVCRIGEIDYDLDAYENLTAECQMEAKKK